MSETHPLTQGVLPSHLAHSMTDERQGNPVLLAMVIDKQYM